MNIVPYIRLARPDNWTKNLLMFAGMLLAYYFCRCDLLPHHYATALWSLASLCLASSANYVLNESLDARSDAYHPIKKNRAAVQHTLSKQCVSVEYLVCAVLAITLASTAHPHIAYLIGLYIAFAWLYNIPPFRLKDRAYMDVLLESANYPIRILLGWMCVIPEALPPSSVLIIGWSIGAFAMSLKRLAEFQLFETQVQAAQYRKSYAVYGLHSLAMSGLVYAMLTIFGATIFALKYKTEMALMVLLLMGWMAWYFWMALQRNACIIYPERLLGNKVFCLLALITVVSGTLLPHSSFTWLHALNQPLAFDEYAAP